MTTQIHWV